MLAISDQIGKVSEPEDFLFQWIEELPLTVNHHVLDQQVLFLASVLVSHDDIVLPVFKLQQVLGRNGEYGYVGIIVGLLLMNSFMIDFIAIFYTAIRDSPIHIFRQPRTWDGVDEHAW